MGRTNTLAVLATVSIGAACGGGGGSGAGFGGSSGDALGVVRLLAHEPAADAVQVELGAAIVLEFDAVMALDSFGDEDTWLRAAGSTTTVAGTFSLGSPGRVRFTPAAPLAAETDYVFQLSALTCDESGRILDLTTRFGFRTFDATPPQLAGVDVQGGATGVPRTRTFTATFSEAIAPSSVNTNTLFLRDVFGVRYAATRTVQGAVVTLAPHADLPGDRQCTLVVGTGVTDRAGNPLASASSTSFRTATDTDAPAVASVWPALQQTGVSPAVQPTFAFDESMDAASVEAASLLFQDEFGSIVAFRVDASADQRTLRLVPQPALQPDRRYTLAFLLGGAAATDVSGNVLEATQALTFTTGQDDVPPTVVASVPAPGESRVPGTLVATVTFDEDLDPAWVTTANVALTAAGEPWAAVVELSSPRVVRVTPVLSLPAETACTLVLRGGQEGLHDVAGNVLVADVAIAFTTSADTGTPGVLMLPPDGAVNVARGAGVRAVFDAPMDPATLTPANVQVTDDEGVPVAGTHTLVDGGRAVAFTPAAPLAPLAYHRVRVRGGPDGVRRTTGNWLAEDVAVRFRTGSAADTTPPAVLATVNGIHASRTQGLVLPPSGFTIDVTASDADHQWPDVGSVEIELLGAAAGPDVAALRTHATIGHGTFRVQVPAGERLAAGAWTLTARVPDLCGNVGQAAPLAFTVAEPDTGALPFERTQVVWVRSDLDRDGNGTADFDDDLVRLGLAVEGDPIGRNAYLRRLLLDGIVAQCCRLYGRGDRGEPVDGGSVAVRFTTRAPIRIPHMQIALGGLDPEGSRDRGFGADSTGVLGRAYYDYRNGNVAERNTASSPGLGVFPAEMWLYQAKIHLQVWPSYQTAFAQRFRPLCPAMGGVPAGTHELDAIVLAPAFDYATANTPQRARWQTIMDAADDWATVIGIILAHEVGHSLGLVAPGPSPTGLFGDASLHDSYASAAEVMAPSVGYEAMTTLAYAFRDVDLAYLRQRVLLR